MRLRYVTTTLSVVVLAGCTFPGVHQPPPNDQNTNALSHRAPPCHFVQGKADRTCSPGGLNGAVTQTTLATTVCKKGWTDIIRPPTSYTDALKLQQMKLYGETGPPADYEEDHVVPLILGGDPGGPQDPGGDLNLAPQPRYGPKGTTAADKDNEERALGRAICLPPGQPGHMSLIDAQKKILVDWTH